jgi:hypothetical protein
MSHRKRSWVDLSQPAETPPMPDCGLAQSQLLQLNPPDNPVLPVSQPSQRLLHITSPRNLT